MVVAFWKQHGLDVSVACGSGSGTAAQAVAAGTFDFGMAATSTVIIQAARPLPITCIGQVNYDALMGIAVLASSPIKTPKDLEGRKLGASVSSGEYPFLPLYAQGTGFDMAKVDLVQLDGKVRERALVEKQVDAVSSFATSTLPSLPSLPSLAPLGTALRFMLYRDAGLNFYGQSLTRGSGRCRNGPAPGLLSGSAFFQSGGVTRGLEWFGSGHQERRRWSTLLGLTCRCS